MIPSASGTTAVLGFNDTQNNLPHSQGGSSSATVALPRSEGPRTFFYARRNGPGRRTNRRLAKFPPEWDTLRRSAAGLRNRPEGLSLVKRQPAPPIGRSLRLPDQQAPSP